MPSRVIRAREVEKLKAEIRQDTEAVARYIEEHGDPVAELQELFGPTGAAVPLTDRSRASD